MKNYILNLLNFSEDVPFLKFSTFGILVIAMFTCFTGCVGFIGGFKSEKCLLLSVYFKFSFNYIVNAIDFNFYFKFYCI